MFGRQQITLLENFLNARLTTILPGGGRKACHSGFLEKHRQRLLLLLQLKVLQKFKGGTKNWDHNLSSIWKSTSSILIRLKLFLPTGGCWTTSHSGFLEDSWKRLLLQTSWSVLPQESWRNRRPWVWIPIKVLSVVVWIKVCGQLRGGRRRREAGGHGGTLRRMSTGINTQSTLTFHIHYQHSIRLT